MLLAQVTIVTGALLKKPMVVMSERTLDYEVSGLLKITRHPVQWGILLFASAHLLANGDSASIIFLERLLFRPSLGCYRWAKGAGGKMTEIAGFHE